MNYSSEINSTMTLLDMDSLETTPDQKLRTTQKTDIRERNPAYVPRREKKIKIKGSRWEAPSMRKPSHISISTVHLIPGPGCPT
jgi:hypothetical protein